MPEDDMTLSDAPPSRTPVELRVRAEYGQLPVLRAIAETIAVLADMNLDHVSDVKLAVDEICSTLIRDAGDDAEIVCRYAATDSALRVRIAGDTLTDRVPDERGFGWHVIRTLTDTLDVAHEPHPVAGGFRTVVEFTKSRDVT